MKRSKKYIIVFIIFVIGVCILGYGGMKISGRNNFSKNITLSNNYFLDYQWKNSTDSSANKESDKKPVSEHNIDVPHISQVGILPNGCETVSAVMLLAYSGYNVYPVDFADKYLEKGEVYIKWGCRYGPDPKVAYAGDPKSEKGGWGCFAPVIAKALNKYLDGEMFAKNLSGSSLEQLVQQYIVNDIPVAIWVTQGIEEIDKLYQWQSYDKSETFLYPVREHCVVLTGFDEEYYYFNDPLSETDETVKYEKSAVSDCFNSMGRQAVAIIDN